VSGDGGNDVISAGEVMMLRSSEITMPTPAFPAASAETTRSSATPATMTCTVTASTTRASIAATAPTPVTVGQESTPQRTARRSPGFR